MKVLIACEESQTVCKAFRTKGHEAYSADLQECSGGHPEWHIQCDVLPLLNGNCDFVTCDRKRHSITGTWDLIIAHPPCTYLSKAGSRWLYKGGKLQIDRYEKGIAGKEFFMKFYNADAKRICIENPVANRIYKLPRYTQIIQPYFFGHNATKATCLWLRNLKPLWYGEYVGRPKTEYFQKKDGSYHAKDWTLMRHGSRTRSKTFEGIAKAMAEQWG